MSEPLRIVFVCTNNFVRSPMAEKVFAAQMRKRGLHRAVRVSSAGTFDDPRWGTKNVGNGVAAEVARLLKAGWGMHDIRHCAEQLNAEHLSADLIVAMDRGHVRKLRELGVPAERIRLLRSFDPTSGTPTPDVEDPEFNAQVEAVYRVIRSSLPGLHDWVDAQFDARVRDTARGFRIWYTRPAEDPLTLYSAMYGTQLQGIRSSTCRTRDRIIRAVCPVHDHDPPAAGCACGIYAVENTLDAVYRLRAMTSNIRGGDSYNCWWPLNPDRRMAPVLAQVKLRRAVEHDDQGTWSVLAHVKQQIGAHTPVLRAASAEITRVFVSDELIGAQAAVTLADRLAASYGVEAVAGFPEYTADEWDLRPAWMYEKPWCTLYSVDSVLSGFTRDGYQRSPQPAL